MFPLFLNKVSFPPSSCSSISSQVRALATLLIPFQARQFSSASSSPSQPHCKPVEEENIRVSVWWNFNDCRVPSGVSVLKTVPSIMGAVRSNGIKGPIDIHAYGDVSQFSKLERAALSSIGIHLCHFTGRGRKKNANKHIFYDLFSWTLNNPPPVHIFLIVGEANLQLLHRLRMSNYNILVAYQGRAPDILYGAATIIWQLSSIFKGEDLTGKHINYPPDGPFNSWYGDSNVPLENPFSAVPSTQKLRSQGKNMDRNADGIPRISPSYVSSVDDDSKSLQSIPSQGKPIGEYVDGKSPFPVREVSSSSSPQPHRNCSCNVSVSVWWDADNCGLPSGVSFSKVAPSILATVRANGIKGKINIRAFGDFYSQFSKVSKVDREVLLSTGIDIHTNEAGKNNTYKNLLMELNYWVYRNPPPAHIFLILGDTNDIDFSGILHRLRMNNYNILIACSGRASDILCSAATVMWSWSSMFMGVDLMGKHFNYPPNCHFNSSYGDSKMPLENPLLAIEEPTSSQNAEIHKLPSDRKLSEVPNSVFGQVRKILSAYPISLGDLRAELQRTSLGSEKIVDVASALLPQIQLPPNDNISKKSDNDTVRSEDGRPGLLEKKTNSQDPSTCNDYIVLENNDIANCEFGIVENEHENPAKGVDEVCRSPYSSPFDNSLVENKRHDGSPGKSSPFFNWISSWCTFWRSGAKSDDLHQDVMHSRMPELFEDSKLAEVDQTGSDFEEPKLSKLHRDVSHSEMHGLFSLGSFWDVVESFVFTPRGSLLLSQSKSREDMTHKLKKHGPPVLRCLTVHDILQLVELLISEKKWLEESPSQAFPFRLTQTAQKSSLMGRSHGAKKKKAPQPNLQKSFKHDAETKMQN